MLAAAKDQEEIAASILLANRADVNQGVPESLAGNPELFYTPLQKEESPSAASNTTVANSTAANSTAANSTADQPTAIPAGHSAAMTTVAPTSAASTPDAPTGI